MEIQNYEYSQWHLRENTTKPFFLKSLYQFDLIKMV